MILNISVTILMINTGGCLITGTVTGTIYGTTRLCFNADINKPSRTCISTLKQTNKHKESLQHVADLYLDAEIKQRGLVSSALS